MFQCYLVQYEIVSSYLMLEDCHDRQDYHQLYRLIDDTFHSPLVEHRHFHTTKKIK